MNNKNKELSKRLKIYWIICAILFLVLFSRLAMVQFLENERYETASKENRIRMVSIKAPRGEMTDRNGKVLAQNKLVYTVYITWSGLKEQDQTVAELSAILRKKYPEMTADYIHSLIEKQKYRPFEPVLVARDIDWETVVAIDEERYNMPGFTVGIEPLRSYPQGFLAGHVLGYVHPIYDQSELQKLGTQTYNLGDLVGKEGVEKVYEKYLKGKDGARRVEVDARGRPVRELVTLAPTPGDNLKLTIDADLQKVLEQSMEGTLKSLQRSYPKARVASAVVLNVKTGEVLAMASYPFLNPNDFTKKMDTETARYYFPNTTDAKGNQVYDPLKPGAATNRALMSAYPPGSTFKPVTAMAALEAGKMSPLGDYVNCAGRYWLPPYIACTGVHGNVNLYKAMAESCNTYFQEMGRRAGKDELIRIAREFGLGQKTGVDLPTEKPGLLPTPEWKHDINSILINRRYDARRSELSKRYAQLIAAAASQEEKEKLAKERDREQRKLEAQYKIDYNFSTKWQAYDTFNMSIGQGSNSYTVMQLANYVATIANGGKRMRPYVVSEITTPEGRLVKRNSPQVISQVSVSAEHLAEVRRAMLEVGKTGTGAFLFSNFPANIQVACKTGTAQTGRAGDVKNRDFHGVFVAFAPYDDPQIAFAGVVEYGRHGGSSAGLIAKAVFEQYFGIKDHLSDQSVNVNIVGNEVE